MIKVGPAAPASIVEHADDVCALSLVRRMAALLDLDPTRFNNGDKLPHGWHVLLFNPPTPQSRLRADGAAHLGVTLPSLGLPRLMMAGRSIDFLGDIPIGSSVCRQSKAGEVVMKTGRSGRFALIDVEHRIQVGDDYDPALIETSSYILREPADATAPPAASRSSLPPADFSRTITPDEALLFRYSAITDNPHRIHYDMPYATGAELYPALVVNGSIPTMVLLEMFREHVGREPAAIRSRNLAPMYCGDPLTLTLTADDSAWLLRAHDAAGRTTLEARAW
jgi:3-methylfumaryl-CoA hydratase